VQHRVDAFAGTGDRARVGKVAQALLHAELRERGRVPALEADRRVAAREQAATQRAAEEAAAAGHQHLHSSASFGARLAARAARLSLRASSPRRPGRQLLAADLGVVADVHREARMHQEGVHAPGVHMALAEVLELPQDAALLLRLHVRFQLHAQHRPLLAARADPDQRGATHARMRVEHRLDLLGVQARPCR
jgi:hypothetical protein